jgi:nitrite reductase/ring-hydroxylating ferredoxin subunit
MLTEADNILLTRTGPKTPMGNLFRRFWQPILLSTECPEPDGPPLRVTILGEDLRVFRTTDGSIGLTSPRCPHRGADLFFGRNEQGGIRCAYHGWKFATDGRCLDLPTMDPGPARDKAERNIRPISARRTTSRRCRSWNSPRCPPPTFMSRRNCNNATGPRLVRVVWIPRISPFCTWRFPMRTMSRRTC